MRLTEIQKALKAPKSNRNTFANYNYRSAEDILEAVKPLLDVEDMLTISDEIVMLGDRFYVKSTAKFIGKGENKEITSTAFARETEDKKGQDAAQITGAASSYARKYCLNGLFCIDDTRDPDTMDNTKEGQKQKPEKQQAEAELEYESDAAPVCPDCNKPMKQSKAGRFYCAGTYNGMCPLPEKDTDTKNFQEELEKTPYPTKQ